MPHRNPAIIKNMKMCNACPKPMRTSPVTSTAINMNINPPRRPTNEEAIRYKKADREYRLVINILALSILTKTIAIIIPGTINGKYASLSLYKKFTSYKIEKMRDPHIGNRRAIMTTFMNDFILFW